MTVPVRKNSSCTTPGVAVLRIFGYNAEALDGDVPSQVRMGLPLEK